MEERLGALGKGEIGSSLPPERQRSAKLDPGGTEDLYPDSNYATGNIQGTSDSQELLGESSEGKKKRGEMNSP